MTDERMALIELVEKAADADLVREMLAFAAERIMDAEAERDCQEFRVRAGIVGKMETPHATTQTTRDRRLAA